MKDIKTLYLTAKSSGKQADIIAYTESIQDLLNNDPNGYISQLEYIISSDIGFKTIKPFIEKNGFPIACYDKMIECLNECIRKCEVYNKDASIYTEAVVEFEKFRKDHINCFMMFENFKSDIPEKYVETYYGKNSKGHQNRKLVAGMINNFGEVAIPDALITADSIGGSAVKTVLEFISKKYNENCATIYEWVLTACKDIHYDESCNEVVNHFTENCLSFIINGIKRKEHQAFRESVIMDHPDMIVEYSEDEIKAVQELIAFKEYQMSWGDEFSESTYNHQNEIYDLYEMMDGMIAEDVADSIIEMLPCSNQPSGEPMDEAMWLTNTRNKKTGEIPGYLAKNHDIHYGEEDPGKKKSSHVDNSSDKEPSLDDFRRPSALINKPGSTLNLPSAYDDKDKNDDNTPSKSSNTDISDEDKRIINNYYYTYTNSLNKNTHSFNKDNSTRDDHSSVTHTGSHNKNGIPDYSLIPEESSKVIIPKKESAEPWELNIFNKDEAFVEDVGDVDLNKPKSDHPIKDILTDIDREATKKQQSAKKKVQDVQNVAKAAVKPVNRTKAWINKLITDWKDADENNIKERMADPRTRNNIFSAIKKAIVAGSFVKAGILLNPVFLFLTVTKGAGKNKREFRIRNEMIGELKTELAILDEKIKDSDSKGDNTEKYKLMRFKNELNKKLIRVGGTKEMSKMI